MSLLEKLQRDRDACIERYKRLQKNLTVCEEEIEKCDAEWADFNVAIAALSQAPAQPPSAELRSGPGAEDEVRDHIPTVRADWDDEPDEVWTQEQLDQIDTDAQAFVEAIGAPQVSIVDDPELQAAVSRAEATLAAAEPAYVGLQDPELDADYDAMKHAYPVTAHDN